MKRILVFPCGSETGLEIHRSMAFSRHFELVGASSVPDHGRFVYQEHISDLPFHDDPAFPDRLAETVRRHTIDAVYPTMDAVAETVQNLAERLGCLVIGSPPETTRICASKHATYDALSDVIPTPVRYRSLEAVSSYPIFMKPDRGYGSRNSSRVDDAAAARALFARHAAIPMLLLEFLPGKEWTIDCFSDRHGRLRFHAARGRNRVSNGISVNTALSEEFADQFATWAAIINERLRPRGAWFFQAKQDASGQPRLLEVAARFAGSSGLQRARGVNLPLLSAFDAFNQEVSIAPNRYRIEVDRALASRYLLEVNYQHVFVDLDDCLVISGRINHQLVAFLHHAVDQGKAVTLITRHYRSPEITLKEFRVSELFDRVIHLGRESRKSDHIDHHDAIFIDDSFSERKDVAERLGIPVFAPDMIEILF